MGINMVNAVNRHSGDKELFYVDEPDGWYFLVPYYFISHELLYQSAITSLNLYHVDYRPELRYEIYVIGKWRALIYKSIRWIESKIYWRIMRNCYRWGFMPTLKDGEMFSFRRHFLVLPRG